MDARSLRTLAALPMLLSACGGEPRLEQSSTGGAAGASGGPKTHQVQVHSDGTFEPHELSVSDGDTVEWILHDPSDAIVPTASESDACQLVLPYDEHDPNQLTGPMPVAAAGIFSLGPFDAGFEAREGLCTEGAALASAGGQSLCETGELGATMLETWENPQITGVFIRALWNRVHVAPGLDDSSFDFVALDREIDRAVAHGKLFSLNFKAGKHGTPDWIFSTNSDGSPRAGGGGGVERLRFRDGGSDAPGCGASMDLGNPADPQYRQHYFDLLRKVAEHLRARADRFRALAYLKLGGANLFSDEARLPKRCDPGCFCNTELWAKSGYRPSKLYAFYAEQEALALELFPGKTLNYMLIQDGFPSVNEQGDYELSDGSSSGGALSPLPGGVEQTETILAAGALNLGLSFSVAHNGVGPLPPSGTCPNEDLHPAEGPYASAGSGCPNKWALRAGADGQVTGFQTNNANGVASPEALGSALENIWRNSDGVYAEVYEQRLWEAMHESQGVLDAGSGKTVADWDRELEERRRTAFPTLPDPAPATHRRTFHRSESGPAVQRLHYVHASKCSAAKAAVGTIEVLP